MEEEDNHYRREVVEVAVIYQEEEAAILLLELVLSIYPMGRRGTDRLASQLLHRECKDLVLNWDLEVWNRWVQHQELVLDLIS